MSDSVRPHRRQPTRLLCPWDSPGKSTGVGCHFLLQCMKVKSESEVAQSCPTLSDPMDCNLPGSSIHGIFQARVLSGVPLPSPQFDSAAAAAAAAKSLQSCPTLCDPMDCSLPGSPVPGIHQARTLEWVAISFSNAWKWKVKVKSLSHVRLFATPWTAAYKAPPAMGFSRQEYWVGCHCLLCSGRIHYCYIILRTVDGKKSLSFLPPWEFQTPLSLGRRSPLDFLSTCLGNDSLRDWSQPHSQRSDQSFLCNNTPIKLLGIEGQVSFLIWQYSE